MLVGVAARARVAIPFVSEFVGVDVGVPLWGYAFMLDVLLRLLPRQGSMRRFLCVPDPSEIVWETLVATLVQSLVYLRLVVSLFSTLVFLLLASVGICASLPILVVPLHIHLPFRKP